MANNAAKRATAPPSRALRAAEPRHAPAPRVFGSKRRTLAARETKGRRKAAARKARGAGAGANTDAAAGADTAAEAEAAAAPAAGPADADAPAPPAADEADEARQEAAFARDLLLAELESKNRRAEMLQALGGQSLRFRSPETPPSAAAAAAESSSEQQPDAPHSARRRSGRLVAHEDGWVEVVGGH